MNNPKFHSTKIWEASLANRAESTKYNYHKHFQDFIEWANLTPDQLREMKWQENQAAKPWERNQVENLLRQYLNSLDKYSCSTQRCAYTAVRSFFEAQGMPLNLGYQDRPVGCAFGSKRLAHEEIRKLKTAAEYLRDKALIMFLKDSGLRESDAAKLLWKNFKDYGEGFWGFEIQTKKKKTIARGFVGSETTEVLKLYREKRLQGTQKLPPEENIEEHPVFALLTDPSKKLRAAYMSDILGNIISLAGIERATPHGLRKFWEQNVHTENPAYQKQLNGRALTEVERAYFWKETLELFEIYKENYRNLIIEKQDFREVEERLRKEYETEIKTLKNRIHDLEGEREGYTKLKQDVQNLKESIDQMYSLDYIAELLSLTPEPQKTAQEIGEKATEFRKQHKGKILLRKGPDGTLEWKLASEEGWKKHKKRKTEKS